MEKLEPLGKGIKIYVNETFHFTTDTILLANFSLPKSKDICCDLGTGCGTIPLLWYRDKVPQKTDAIDIQEDAIDLLKKSLKLNKIENITPHVLDIKDVDKALEKGMYDVVVCNPPYKLKGSGIENPDDNKKIINHETMCNLDDICKAASKLLKFSGSFYMCQRPERLTDVLETLRKYELEPKRLRLVQQRKNKSPKLFLVEAKLKSNKGFMQVDPALIIEDENGNFSHEMNNIYSYYKEEFLNG